jgi:hypothetical protein
MGDEARRLRRRGRQITEIAEVLNAPEEDIRQALATMRTRTRTATRKTLNVTIAAHEFVCGEQEPREACWETVDRLMGELTIRRALMGASVARVPTAPRE